MLWPVLDCARIAAEFALGEQLAATPLAGGHPDVTRLTTERGTFVVKPAVGIGAVDLYEQAVLEQVPAPAKLPAAGTVWDRVASAE